MLARGIGALLQGGYAGYSFGEEIKDRRRSRERQDRLDAAAEEQRGIDNARADRQQDRLDAAERRTQEDWERVDAYRDAEQAAAAEAAAAADAAEDAAADAEARAEDARKARDAIVGGGNAGQRAGARGAVRPAAEAPRSGGSSSSTSRGSRSSTSDGAAPAQDFGSPYGAGLGMVPPSHLLPPREPPPPGMDTGVGLRPSEVPSSMPPAPPPGQTMRPASPQLHGIDGRLTPPPAGQPIPSMVTPIPAAAIPLGPRGATRPAAPAPAAPPPAPREALRGIGAWADPAERPMGEMQLRAMEETERQDRIAREAAARQAAFPGETPMPVSPVLRDDYGRMTPPSPPGAFAPQAQPAAPGPDATPAAPAAGTRGAMPRTAQGSGAPTAPDAGPVPDSPVAPMVADLEARVAQARPQINAARARGATPPSLEQEATRQARDWVDHWAETGAPLMAEFYLRNGRIEEAQAVTDWVEDREVRQGLELYYQARLFAEMGDLDRAASAAIQLYNLEGYFGDGLTVDEKATAWEYDAEGNRVGMTVAYENDQGERFTQTWNSIDDLIQHTLQAVDPIRAFELDLQHREAARTVAAETAATAQQRQDDLAKRVRDIAAQLAEEMPADLVPAPEGYVPWAMLPREQQAALIEERMAMEDELAAQATARASSGESRRRSAPAADMRF